jgi:peptidoglycan/xylan/chitin deacetylase (PgdA/CDA1 family)
VNRLARRLATTLLGTSQVNRAVRALAAVRGHALVLVYHRVGPPLAAGCQLVPSVPAHLLRTQLRALDEVVDFVALDEIVEHHGQTRSAATRRRRPMLAVTFDDDLPSHVEQALPVLRECGVPATFFLSGRALHGMGAYWFQHLEILVSAYGPRRTAELLAVPDLPAEGLALACERDAGLRRRVCDVASGLARPPILDREGCKALTAAGMAIGFHTVEHQTLPDLNDVALADAIERGQADLAAAVRAPVRFFAYPHGKADARVAAAVRRAGFGAAFTGRQQPVRRGDDPYLLGRWEPGPLGAHDLLVRLAVRLHTRSPSAHQAGPWM